MPESSTAKKLDLSIVVPVFNEEESLLPLHDRIEEITGKLGLAYEIIYVDDGSTDGSWSVLKKIQTDRPDVVLIRLRRNFGKADALSSGFQHARGGKIITMDADLQDEPGEIPGFLDMLDDGYDLVSGWKFRRKDPISKTFPSRIFNFFTSLIAGVRLHDFNCGFKGYSRDVVANLRIYGELHRYIPVIAHWKGFHVGEMKVEHHPRKYGRSKYGAGRLLKGMVDLLTVVFLSRFTKRPLHLFGSLGAIFLFLGFLINLYLTVIWFFVGPIGWRPLLFLGIMLVNIGIQLISLGLIGEMITNVAASREKRHIIREIVR